MAQKTITELTLRSDIDDTCNVPTDDTIQTYRITFAMIWSWIWSRLNSVVTITDTGTTLVEANKLVLLNPSADFTQALPAVAGCSGWILTFKNIATNGKVVTLDADGSELIDNALTLELGSSPTMESAKLYCNGSKWLII